MHRLQELVRLHRLKTSAREVCRLLGMGRTTEWHYRQALAKTGLLVGDPSDLPAVEVIKAATTRAATDAIAQQEISTVEPWRAHAKPSSSSGSKPRRRRSAFSADNTTSKPT
jgi:hypothetical protein